MESRTSGTKEQERCSYVADENVLIMKHSIISSVAGENTHMVIQFPSFWVYSLINPSGYKTYTPIILVLRKISLSGMHHCVVTGNEILLGK